MHISVGIVGFGEVGQAFAGALQRSSECEVRVFDVRLASNEHEKTLRERAEDHGVELCESLEALIEGSELIMSTVVAAAAFSVASDVSRLIDVRHTYFDLNSTSPELKRSMANAIEATNASFVEGAIMAAVPKLRHRVPILACGGKANDLVVKLNDLGLNVEYFGEEVGRASATKMMRSVVVKGMEALLLECALGAEKFGVTERVLDYVEQGYPGINWNELAHFLMGRTVLHGERRAQEMVEAAKTLEELRIEPIMARAAANRLSSVAKLNVNAVFPNGPPATYQEAIAKIYELQSGTEHTTT